MAKTPSTLSSLFFFLLLLALAAYGQQEKRVAIIQTLDDSDSIKPADLAYLTDKLRETAVNVLPKQQYGVMTTESIVAFLGSQERAQKECRESSCLAELGRKVNADYVAQGRIGRFGKELTIKVELYNSKSGNLIGSFTGDSKTIYGLRDIINEKATGLFKLMIVESKTQKNEPSPEVATPASLQPVPVADSAVIASIQALIEEDGGILGLWGTGKNRVKIQKASFPLSSGDKMALYKKNEKSALVYAGLNVLPGFGLGSYMQGGTSNIVLGVLLSLYDVAGIALLVNQDKFKNEDNPNPNEMDAKMMGYTIIAAGRILGAMSPFLWKWQYNRVLREALNIDNEISVSIDPLIVPRDGTPAVGLAFNVSFF